MNPRVHVNVLIGPKGVEWVDETAEMITAEIAARTTRSDVLRACLLVARQHESEVRAVLRARA